MDGSGLRPGFEPADWRPRQRPGCRSQREVTSHDSNRRSHRDPPRLRREPRMAAGQARDRSTRDGRGRPRVGPLVAGRPHAMTLAGWLAWAAIALVVLGALVRVAEAVWG